MVHGFLAVTAVCLVTHKTIYEGMGGLNETNCAVAF